MAETVALAEELKASSRYTKLEQDRNGALNRARECALLTIPSIMPAQGFSATSKLPTPYQSLGAQGVRTLASKMYMSAFPSIPFFNYKVDDLVLEKMTDQARGEIELLLARRERATTTELDTSKFRPLANVAFQHLIVTGNIGAYIPPQPDAKAQLFRLDQYVVRRDGAGNLLEFVIQEKMDFAALPQAVKEEVAKTDQFAQRKALSLEPEPVELYTHGYLDAEQGEGMWIVYQEAAGLRIESTVAKFKKDDLAYVFPRIAWQPGEHYGRSYVEEFLGDLDSLEALCEALVEGSAAAAKIIFLVNPAGTTTLKVVTDSKTGDVRAGRADDVTVVQAQKQADLRVAKDQAEVIASRLAKAFLLQSSIQRSGERVTAEEIRYMATELDDGLGGMYTLISAEFQHPVVRLLERRMEKRVKVEKLPPKITNIVIVTGLAAIGRGHDQRNLQMFTKEIIGTLGAELAMRYLNGLEYLKRSAAAYNIDTTGLVKTAEEVEQAEQQAQMMAMMEKLGPNAINQAGGMAQTAMAQPPPPPEQG
jgi:hypothetical protein